MLPRVLEVEVMDSPAEARDYDAMDHKAVNRAFADDFLAAWSAGQDSISTSPSAHLADAADAELPKPLLLDLGTGTGQIPIEICRRGEAAAMRFWAVDLASHMLHLARGNVEIAGLSSRIHLDRVDAKALPYPDGHFAAVISNSIVHHIPDPRAVLAEAVRVTCAGGLIFVRDLLRPDDEATWAHLVETYAAGANAHQRAMFGDSLRAALTLPEIQAIVQELGLPRDTVQATSDRHWTWNSHGGL